MLVLTRKRAETIHVGQDILIKVIRTGRTSVKIGIEAPANVRVVRGELLDGHDPSAVPEVNWCPTEAEEPEAMVTCADESPQTHLA
jgi:carbon storage regulator CsrA